MGKDNNNEYYKLFNKIFINCIVTEQIVKLITSPNFII